MSHVDSNIGLVPDYECRPLGSLRLMREFKIIALVPRQRERNHIDSQTSVPIRAKIDAVDNYYISDDPVVFLYRTGAGLLHHSFFLVMLEGFS